MEEWFKSESNGSDINYGDLAGGSQCHEGSFFLIFSFVTGWVDVMSVPILGLSLGYMYHPMYPSPKFEVPRGEELPCDPTQWEPDVISLELEAGPAALKVFGSLLAMLAAIKVRWYTFLLETWGLRPAKWQGGARKGRKRSKRQLSSTDMWNGCADIFYFRQRFFQKYFESYSFVWSQRLAGKKKEFTCRALYLRDLSLWLVSECVPTIQI